MSREARVLGLTGLAVVLAAFDGSLLFLALPALAAEFRAGVPDLSNLGSVVALGSLGALPLAAMADRTGRRRLLVVGLAAFSLADVASALAPGLALLAASRVVAGCFESLVGGVAVVMVVEEMPPQRRALAVGALTVASGLGSGATLLAYPLLAPHWRPLYAAGGVGLLASLLVWRLLPESRVWEAAAPAPDILRRLLQRPWRLRLAVLSVTGALGSVAYQPGGLFVALFGSRDLGLSPGAISTVIFVSGLVAGSGYLLGGWLGDRFGRRLGGVGLSILAAGAAGLTFSGGVSGYLGGNVAWGFLAGAAGPILTAWFAELFPTRIRVTAEAAASVAGAMGGVAGLQLAGRLAQGLGLGPTLAGLTAGPLIGAVLLLVLPETRAQALPELGSSGPTPQARKTS